MTFVGIQFHFYVIISFRLLNDGQIIYGHQMLGELQYGLQILVDPLKPNLRLWLVYVFPTLLIHSCDSLMFIILLNLFSLLVVCTMFSESLNEILIYDSVLAFQPLLYCGFIFLPIDPWYPLCHAIVLPYPGTFQPRLLFLVHHDDHHHTLPVKNDLQCNG